MGYVTDKSADVYRDFVTAGVPASGHNDPAKPDIRGLFSFLDGALATLLAGFVADQAVVVYAARSSLYANLTPADRTLGLVYNDGVNNGLYIKNGAAGSGSWNSTGLMLQGQKGDAATIGIGTVMSGTAPAVTNTGTPSAAVLNFVLQRGSDGKSFLQAAIDTGYIPAGTTEVQFVTVLAGQITQQATADAQGYRQDAAGFANAAENARDITLANTTYYASVSAGHDATADGQIFAVSPGDGTASFYRRVGANSTFLFENASRSYVDVRSPDIYLGLISPYGLLGTADDSATINAALVAAMARGCARVHLPYGTFKANIVIPARGPTAFFATIELVGACKPSYTFGTVGSVPRTDYGTVIEPADATKPIFRQIDYLGGFALVCVALRDLTFRNIQNPTADGVDVRWAAQFVAEDIQIDTGTYSRQCIEPTNNSVALRTPNTGNGALTSLRRVSVVGHRVGINVQEHTSAEDIMVHACKYGLEISGALSSGRAPHASCFGRVLMQAVPNPIYVSARQQFKIGELVLERMSATTSDASPQNAWQLPNVEFADPGNAARAVITYSSALASVGESKVFKKAGGKGALIRHVGEVVPRSLFILSSAQQIPAGTETNLVFQSADNDFASAGTLSSYGVQEPDPSTNPSRIYFRHAGNVRITFKGEFASGGAGVRSFRIYKNGNPADIPMDFLSTSGRNSAGIVSQILGIDGATFGGDGVTLASEVGDYIQITAWHNDGSPLTVSNTGGSGLLEIEYVQ